MKGLTENVQRRFSLAEWKQFRELEPSDLNAVVRQRNIIDGWNCLDRENWHAAGWVWRGLGRR
jgi:UDPglucose 6-dehydrogenase